MKANLHLSMMQLKSGKKNLVNRKDQSKYRVWDYPVKEQYTHILKMIEESGPVETPHFGCSKVEAAFEGEFAFINDAEIKLI